MSPREITDARTAAKKLERRANEATNELEELVGRLLGVIAVLAALDGVYRFVLGASRVRMACAAVACAAALVALVLLARGVW